MGIFPSDLNEPVNNGPFKVGERVIFAHLLIDKDPLDYVQPTLRGMSGDLAYYLDVAEVDLKAFICAEHHQVPYDQYPDDMPVAPKHDGYIFHDEDGRPWYNNYPMVTTKAFVNHLTMANHAIVKETGEGALPVDAQYRVLSVEFIIAHVWRILALGLPLDKARDLIKFYDEVLEQLKDRFGLQPEIGLVEGLKPHGLQAKHITLVPVKPAT